MYNFIHLYIYIYIYIHEYVYIYIYMYASSYGVPHMILESYRDAQDVSAVTMRSLATFRVFSRTPPMGPYCNYSIVEYSLVQSSLV